MKKQYFVQYSDASLINDFVLPKGKFESIAVGIRDMETDFLFTLIQNISSFPVFFVLESVIFEHIETSISEKNISHYKFSSDGYIIKIDSTDILEWVCTNAVELVLNGLEVFIFFGEDISEVDLVPTRNWDSPTEFKNLDFDKVETFIDVYEVGLTIFTKNEKFNSPKKVTPYISADYLFDLENSDTE
ncbi:hypothetical protein [Planococcus faecalis]|uniref:Uncharacterized protein n=1 Tax=Planococcus faecalis TaxID=1598147 RepID=A0ABM6ISQ2_9BACL|nr:hypothetical protein [Planococcus faecalis]AQU79548.1 hypothetical protein AJGP001_09885 [Planococcus faecalis]OHX53169.1 hypothetical protein BB777_10945 [Planococcus faecalis]